MKKKLLFALIAIVAVVLLAFAGWMLVSDSIPAGSPAAVAEKTSKKAIRDTARKERKSKADATTHRPDLKKFAKSGSGDWELDDFDDADHPYSAEDKKVALALQKASDAMDEFDEDDFVQKKPQALVARKRFYEAVAAAFRSGNPSVRSAGVDACRWRGAEALPELTPMMADADAEVAEAAIDAAQDALNDMDDSLQQFNTAAAYMNTFSSNGDALDVFSSTLVSSALDIIDAADDTPAAEAAALANRNAVVKALSEMIENGNGTCVDAAKAAYSDITAEDWISRSEAERWAQNPDNYEAPGLN